MTPKRTRLAAAALAAACTAQLAVAGIVVAHRWGDASSPSDVLRTIDQSPTATPTSSAVTPTPTESIVVPDTGESPGADLPSGSAAPGPSTTASEQPDAGSPKLSSCHGLQYTDAPDAAERFTVDRSGEDAGSLVVDGGAAYFTETKRNGSFDTSLVRVDLATGLERRSDRDAFFNLTDASAGQGWGVDRDGVVQIDGVSGHVVRRWATSQFPVRGSSGLYNQPGLVSVDEASAYVFGFDGPEVALSRIDVASGDVRWTIPLPVEGAGTGFSSGPRRVVDAYGGNAYVALPMRPNDEDVLRVWKIDASGDVVKTRDVSVPNGDAGGPSQLVVTGDGVFTSMTTKGGDLDATILRLDPDSLSTLASADVRVLEDLAAGNDAVWAVTLQCNTILWHRYTPGDLKLVDHPWALPDQSYSVGPAGNRVWSLRTRDPMEAVALVAYPT
jgi:hypothetical protein